MNRKSRLYLGIALVLCCVQNSTSASVEPKDFWKVRSSLITSFCVGCGAGALSERFIESSDQASRLAGVLVAAGGTTATTYGIEPTNKFSR